MALPRPLLISASLATLVAVQMGIAIGIFNGMDKIISTALQVSVTSPLGFPLVVSTFCPAGFVGSQLSTSLLGNGFVQAFNNMAYLCVASGCFAGASYLMCSASLSLSFSFLLLSRMLVGIASGAGSVMVPRYLMEISPRDFRGFLGAFFQGGVVLGIFFVNLFAKPFTTSTGWGLYLFAFPACIGMVQVGLSAKHLHESPIWLEFKDRQNEAARSRLKLGLPSSDVAEAPLLGKDSNTPADNREAITVRELVMDSKLSFPFAVVAFILVAQQLSGINAIFFYVGSTSLFSAAGVQDPFLATLAASFVNAASTLAVLPLIETTGRKKLLLSGTIGMAISGIVLWFALSSENGTLAVMVVLAYICFFELGLGAIPWMLGGECFPENAKDSALASASGLNWAANFCVGAFYPQMQAALKSKSFLPFSVVLIAATMVIWCFLPETKGRDAREIVEMMNSNKRDAIRLLNGL